MTALLAGCAAAPLRDIEVTDPPLRAIQVAFQRTVEAAYDTDARRWHSGLLGNIWVNTWGERHVGLCYHWKYLVYQGVLPAVRRAGWQAHGIVINQGRDNEHHAVVVFDPRRVSADAVLVAAQREPAYVLDAWRSGRADIYRLGDWLRLPLIVSVPARLIDIRPEQAPEELNLVRRATAGTP